MLGAFAQTGAPTGIITDILIQNPSLILAMIFGIIVYIGLSRSHSITWQNNASKMALVMGFGLFLFLTFGVPQQTQSFYTATDISRIMPVFAIIIPLLIIVAVVVKASGSRSYGSKGLSWKTISFFIGIGFIAGASIISNFLNMPTLTTPLLGLGVLLIIVSLVGSLSGLKHVPDEIYTTKPSGKGKHKVTIFIKWSDGRFADNSEWMVHFHGPKRGKRKKRRHDKGIVEKLPGGVYDFWAEAHDKKLKGSYKTKHIKNHPVDHSHQITLVAPLSSSTSSTSVQHQLNNLSQYLHALANNIGAGTSAGQQINQAAQALHNLAGSII